MRFGPVEVAAAAGGVVAHSVRRDALILKKGQVIGAAEIAALHSAGVHSVVVARLEAGDVGEDEAALKLARAVAGENLRVDKPFTGRSNLFAEAAGVFVADATGIDRINMIDESVTLATLPPYRTVVAGEMVATVKIIPFAVPGAVLEQSVASAALARLSVRPFKALRVGVVSTVLPGLKASVIDKTLRILEGRLAPAQAQIVKELRTPHETSALAEAIAQILPSSDLVIVFGASAITDRRDVIPAAIEAAGGRIEHLGMPVDPGNLLLIGSFGEGGSRKPVLGAPGCARSPAENGFDWVLHRLLAGIEVTGADVKRMGAGGLLMEIVSRGQLRTGDGKPHDA